jgi:hypothetical protein
MDALDWTACSHQSSRTKLRTDRWNTKAKSAVRRQPINERAKSCNKKVNRQPSGTVPWSDRAAKNAPCRFRSAKFTTGQNMAGKKQIHLFGECPTQRARPRAAPEQNKIKCTVTCHLQVDSSGDYLRPGQQIRRRTREWRSWSIFPAAFCGPRGESCGACCWCVCCMLFVYCFSERALFYMALIFFIPVHTKLRGYQIFRKDWNNRELSSMGAFGRRKNRPRPRPANLIKWEQERELNEPKPLSWRNFSVCFCWRGVIKFGTRSSAGVERNGN